MKHKYIKFEKENMARNFITGCAKIVGNMVKEVGKTFMGKKVKQELNEVTREENRIPSTQQEPCGGAGQPPCAGAGTGAGRGTGAGGGGVGGPGVVPDELEVPPFDFPSSIFGTGHPDSPHGSLRQLQTIN